MVKGNGEHKIDVLIRLYKSVSNPHDYIDIKVPIKHFNAELLAIKLEADYEKLQQELIGIVKNVNTSKE